MRRKNMLALGMSLALCTGLFVPASYADSIDTKDSYVPAEIETNSEKNSFETASAVEGLEDFSEETAVEGKTASIEEEVSTAEAEDSEELNERKDESLEDSKEDIGGTESTVVTSGYSGFRSAVATKPLNDKVVLLTAQFEDQDAAARDHMKVIRKKNVSVATITFRGPDRNKISNPSSDAFKIFPERVVEKKVNNQWEVYTLDYYTPGEYRYKYTLAEGKENPYYIVSKDTPDGDFGHPFTSAIIQSNYFYRQGNDSHILNIRACSREDTKYKYYPMESESFIVEEERPIAKVYLSSTFNTHQTKVGDPMKRVTVQVEKLILTDDTVVEANSFTEPFLVNVYRTYSDAPNQFKLALDSYRNAAGELADVWNAPEGMPIPSGKYKVYYLLRPNYKIGKYRFLIKGTDDPYGTGTEFYVNNELYSSTATIPEKELTASVKISSDFFEPMKVEKNSGGSSGGNGLSYGNTGSSSKGSSGGSSSSSGSSGGSSGGGSGSFKVSSSFSGQVLGVDRSLSGGQWVQDEKGWWYKRADGSYPKNSWGYEAYNGKSYWYYFLDSGYMATGWIEVNGSKYYLFPNSDGWKGRMLTGWQWIDGNCYYLDPQGQNEGALYKNTTTPDGYAVDAEGRWVVNGVVQKQ